MCEALEPRLVLAGAPLPSLSLLENPNNPVVRFETDFGVIDIELFASQAPITVNNFLSYNVKGEQSMTFFHRLSPGFILQGGGYRYDDDASPRLSTVPTDPPIVLENSGRSNVTGTIAMARSGTPNSATNQFFFNIGNNTFLNPSGPGTGFTVFGRVINGWNVVLTINALTVVDPLTSGPGGGPDPDLGDVGTPPGVDPNDGVPVTPAYVPSVGFRETSLVWVHNSVIIKPQNVTGYYESRMYYPDGWRGTTNSETIFLTNPNNAIATYQVIVHYESGLRDRVLDASASSGFISGTIAPNSTASFRLSDFADGSLNKIRNLTPYAIEVHSALPNTTTDPRPVSAAISRFDFNALVGESFLDISDLSDTELSTWDFARIERTTNLDSSNAGREFLAWQSVSVNTANVTVTFYRFGAAPVVFETTLDPYRRGGLDIAALGLTPGTYSARVSSTEPIVAAVADFDLGPGSNPGWTALGVPSGTTNRGVLPAALMQSSWTSMISFINPGTIVAVMQLSFIRDSLPPGVAPPQQVVTVLTQSRTDYILDPATLGIPVGERFSILYTSNVSVAAHYTSIDEQGRLVSGASLSDGVSAGVPVGVWQEAHFADGFLDPSSASNSEIVSVYNPFSDPSISFSVVVSLIFNDGTRLSLPAQNIAANRRIDVRIENTSLFLSKISSANAFRNFAIDVRGTAVQGSTTFQVSGVAQLTHLDRSHGRASTTMGSGIGSLIALNDPIFTSLGGGSGT